jgi:tetratricopeptide (TPR) repeat protein
MRKPVFAATLAVVLAGCTLYNEVEVRPLTYDPTKIQRGSDIQGMLRKFDLNRAVQSASLIESRKPTAADLGALGAAEVAAGRYEEARRHLRAAIDLEPFRTVYSALAWNLSELEYMSNNYDASLDWARIAAEHGINVRKWHLDYLAALSNVNAYRFSGAASDRVTMRMGRPDVPRIEVNINDNHNVSALIDSGAVLSIMSERLAGQLQVRRLGTIEGSFAGLLGEPIPVHFGILDHLDIGAIKIGNVPVAIMPDDKMKFLAAGKKEFHIDLLLGANLLKEFRLELDFRHNIVTFTHLKPTERRPQADQNLFWTQFRPAVRGTINRHGWFIFVLDTGSEVTFLNQTQLEAFPIPLVTPKIHNATLQGLGGAKKHGEKIEGIELGIDRWGGVFRDMPMYQPSDKDQTSGIVGENYLRNFIVTIDFGRMRVDLKPTVLHSGGFEEEMLRPGSDARQLPPS